MTSSTWRIVAGAFTLAALIAGFLVAWALLRPAGDVQADSDRQSYNQPISSIVFADFESSDIEVTAGDAQVQITRGYKWTGNTKPRYTETWAGDVLRISHSCGDVDSDDCSIRYTVKVPASVKVETETSSGDVTVTGVTGAVRISSVSGDVRLSGLTGAVTVQAVSGDVSADALSSKVVDAKAISGDVRLTYAAAPQTLSVETVSGDTNITVPKDNEPYKVSLQTTSGDQRVTVDQSTQAQRTIRVQATSGDVTIGYV